MIFLADFAMSLDNMLAVAGASHGNWKLLLGGLVISIAIIMTCSNLIAQLMNRYHWIVTLGAAILAFTAGEMMMGDREVAGYFVRNHRVSFDKHWEAYMVSHAHVAKFDGGAELPELVRQSVGGLGEQPARRLRDALVAIDELAQHALPLTAGLDRGLPGGEIPPGRLERGGGGPLARLEVVDLAGQIGRAHV